MSDSQMRGESGASSQPASGASPGAAAPAPYPDALADAERLREEHQQRLAAIVESSDDAIVSKTLDGIVRTWNSGAQRIFGYTAEEMVGRSITVLIPPGREQEEPQILDRLRRGERVDHFETVRVRKDGQQIEVSVTISPIRDRTGRIVGASKIARDITLQKQFERQLKEAKEQAEAGNRAKDHFLSVLSHELRTPLTPALTALTMMERRADLGADLRGEIGMIRRNVETEARLVDDLLDLTRISRGKVELRFEVVDAHAAARETLAMFQREMDAKGLEVTLALRARQHHVWADPGRLRQMFLNLLSNAVKFTPEGGTIYLRSSNDPEGRLRFEVRDTGVGIEKPVLARLFEPFEQGEQTITRRFGGLGLGLSITRSLAQMHGGSICAHSDGPGKGATFIIELPTVSADATSGDDLNPQSPSDEQPLNAPALRVLLVEDHDDTRNVMNRLLTSFGCRVTTAATVREALAVAERQEFDLLVSDIGLPDGSGTDIMRQLRARQNIRGIALSGFGQSIDLQRSEEAGFETHLIKPVNLRALQDVLRKVAQ